MGALHNKWYKCHKMLLTLSHKILPTIILLKSTPPSVLLDHILLISPHCVLFVFSSLILSMLS